MRRLNLGMILIGGLFALSGCVLGPIDPKLTFTRGKFPPPIEAAPAPGNYMLYAGEEFEPYFTVRLAPGDRYGFVRKGDDSIVAVAKDQEYSLGGKLVEAWHWRSTKPAE